MRLQPYLDISQSPDLKTFEGRLIDFASELQFGIVTASVVVGAPGHVPTKLATVGNTPEAYAETFDNPESSIDCPVMKRLKTQSIPFTYDQKLYVREGAGIKWEAQAPHGYKTGLAVALHLPEHRFFLLGVDRDDALPSDPEHLTLMLASLQMLAVHAQDAAFRLLGSTVPVGGSKLTKREVEVLRWTLDGKSAWSIGQILGVSESTINFHIKNTLRKLRVTSKHQAAVKALSHGLL